MKVEPCCYTILTDYCVNCGACVEECPQRAIYENEIDNITTIYAPKCNCCVGLSEPLCVSVCPVEIIVKCSEIEN